MGANPCLWSNWDRDVSLVIIRVSARATSICVLDVTGLTEGRSRRAGSRSCPSNGLRDFLPLAAGPPFLAVSKKVSPGRLPLSFQPLSGCRSIAFGLSTVIEVAMGAAREKKE